MTTEIQIMTSVTKNSTTQNAADDFAKKMSTKLDEAKGNISKPLSLRPNRSVKKNTSLKPLGLRSR